MKLENEFTITTDPDRAFGLLLDLRRVAPCVPGAELGEPDDEGVYPGRVSVKVGPMKFTYDGRVRIGEQDAATRTAVIMGEGRASGGSDTARVSAVMRVLPEGTGSRVVITTDLEIKGRAAQMGQGVIADVSKRLVKDTAACIEARLASPDGDDVAAVAAQPVGGLSLMASVVGARMGDSVRRLGGRGRTEDTTGKANDDGTS